MKAIFCESADPPDRQMMRYPAGSYFSGLQSLHAMYDILGHMNSKTC